MLQTLKFFNSLIDPILFSFFIPFITWVFEVIFQIVAAWLDRPKDTLVHTSVYFVSIFDFKA